MLYFLIILVTMLVCVTVTVIVSLAKSIPLWYAVTMPFLIIFTH